MIIQCDVDGVLANFTDGCLAVMREMGFHFEPHHVVQWDIAALLPRDVRNTFWKLLYRPGFCYHLPLYEGAQDAFVQLVKAGHDVRFLTSAGFNDNLYWESERIGWLQQHFGHFHPVNFSDNKHLADGDLLIEDKLETVQAWADTGRPAILVDRPYNQGRCGPRIFRAASTLHAAHIALDLSSHA